jgi:endonuclease/exonuclease/phosphatase family metal-dependent hydrolase
MKQIFVLFFFISSTVISQPLHVMSFNIRLNVKSDSLNAWPFRKDLVAAQVLFHEIHLLGVQEALHEQMLDLQQRLPDFKYAGVARDDGKQKGEYSAIFYDTARLKLLHSETFWLSESPTIPGSKSWDAAITRVVTWAKLLDRKSGIMFFAFNTHFDHMGKEARRQSARLILEKVHAIAGHIPVIITGDFNSQPSDDPIQILTSQQDSLHLTDTKNISQTPHYGPSGTFNGFTNKETSDQPIDFIFMKNGGKVLQHATLSQTWMGRFSSDHFPVFAKIVLSGKNQKSAGRQSEAKVPKVKN